MHTPKQFKKLHKLSKKVSHQNKTINMLVNLLSGALGYAPGVGPSKSLIEGIRRRDMISNRHINALEAVLKIGAGVAGWAGYYQLASPLLHDSEFTTDNMSWYMKLEIINMILYTLSGLVAGGEKTLHTKQQLINLFNKASYITSRPQKRKRQTEKTDTDTILHDNHDTITMYDTPDNEHFNPHISNKENTNT